MFFLSKTYATGVNTFGKKISSGVRLPSGNQLKRVGSFIAANFSKKQTALLGKKSSTFFLKKNEYLYGVLQKTQLIINTEVRVGVVF